MRTWKIKVTLRCGLRYEYLGIFRTAIDAIIAVTNATPELTSVSVLRAEVQA